MTLARAENLIQLGRHAEALEALAGTAPATGSARAHCLRARAHLGLKHWAAAEAAAGAGILADPDSEWGYRLAAIAVRHQGQPAKARQLAQEAVRRAPGEAFAHQVAALTALDNRDPAEALGHAEAMVELRPNDADSHRTLGRCLMAGRQWARAEAALRQALELDAQDHEAMTLLAEIVGARDDAEARELRLAALRAAPQNPVYRRNVLRRGGAAAGGGAALAVGKAGLLAKIAAFGVLNSMLAGAAGQAVGLVAIALGYAGTFAVTRLRRRRVGRALPPLVWAGTRADRRNADLVWLAVPAGFLVLAGVLGSPGDPRSGLPVALVGALVLAGCWRLRLGGARNLTLAEAVRTSAQQVRQRRSR